MVTGVFRLQKPESYRRTLRNAIVFMPYIIVAIVLTMAIVIYREWSGDTLRGTLNWLDQSGMDIRFLGVYMAGTSGIGAIFWHRARRHFLISIGFLFFVSLPYLFYTACATYYLTNITDASPIAVVAYWGGYLFCFMLFTLISVLLAWLEVANFRGGG